MTQFDWSEFHPLDHHVLNPTCSGWAGGEKRHIELWWKFQFTADPPVIGSIRRRLRCRRGYHDVTGYWNGGPWELDKSALRGVDGFMCYDCDWTRSLR